MSAPRRAVIVIDVQNEYFTGLLPVQFPPREDSLARITEVIDTAASQGLPVAVVQHKFPEGAPVFAQGSEGWQLHPQIAERVRPEWKRSVKNVASVFADDSLVEWLREKEVDTVTLVGYMTNNCVIGSAAAAEPLGIAVEVLSDATGAIHLANEAGSASGQQVHETLMALLHSNFAAVATTEAWTKALGTSAALPKSDLGSSAVQGRETYGDAPTHA
ncbi:isochorismatase family protein [Brachybacterium saurashtrense]|uniref:Isochorismatase family protein n=1 Tax=Brachybacterium saurashtrense TaxID=556288 RepID=A0A345YLQ5_9MICO|nr:isochorismatase family protein [Brachybacterium saurashtrense]AXK44857.1 isochorismatase family protein [Brachybacterium saurashtrense]RRR20734.1 isochorismatase family protein [Brachybacterium saurashtrense]